MTNNMFQAGVLLLDYQGVIFNSNKITYSVTGGYQHSRGGIVHLPMQFTSPIFTLKMKQGWWASPSAFSITYTGRLPVLVPYSCSICIGVFPGLLLCISCVFKLYQRSIHKQLTSNIHTFVHTHTYTSSISSCGTFQKFRSSDILYISYIFTYCS